MHGKIEFLLALLARHTQFDMLGTFVNDQVNAGGSAILIRKTRLHGETVLKQVITQQGRDQVVKIQSENERAIDDCQCTSGTWLTLFDGLGVITGDFHTSEREEWRFTATSQTFSDVDPGQSGGRSFRMPWKEPSQASRGRKPLRMGHSDFFLQD